VSQAYTVDFIENDLGGGITQYVFNIDSLLLSDIPGSSPGEFVCLTPFNQTLDSENSGTGDIHTIDPTAHALDTGAFNFTFNSDDVPPGEYTNIYIQSQPIEGSECTNASANGFLELITGNPIFSTLPIIEENTNETWGSPNGFWGDTTPSAIIGDMEASVQATGVNIWPLMTFVGIPIAFLIALYLIWLINKTLTPPKKSDENVINPQGENFIYHSAEDLEFKREYGQVKRKRGRPRKYPL